MDRPRRETWSERRADAIVHLIGVVAGLSGCVALALVAASVPDARVLASLAVYGLALLAMLGCSAVYNVAGGRLAPLWRRLDHAAIFVMIAGTYTPFLTLALDEPWGAWLLTFVWTGAAAGAALKLIHPEWNEALSIGAYLSLGWSIVVALDPLIAALAPKTLALLAAGAFLYSTGVLFYRRRQLPYHRAIWHGFVLAAAACHYAAILSVVSDAYG